MKNLCSAFLLLLTFAIASCGDDDNGQPTDPVIVEPAVLGTEVSEWSVDHLFIIDPPTSGCYTVGRVSSNVGDVLANGIFSFHGTAYGCGPGNHGCVGTMMVAILRSAQQFDFTEYTDLRLKCLVRTSGAIGSDSAAGGLSDESGVKIEIRSTAPAQPDTVIALDTGVSQALTETNVDLSLSDALGFQDATVVLSLVGRCNCAHTGSGSGVDPLVFSGGSGLIEIRDFRIVGTPRTEGRLK